MPLMTRGLGEDPFKALQGALFDKMRQQQQEKKANEMMEQQNQSMHDIISQEVNNFNGRDEKVKDSVNDNLKDQGINATVDNVNTGAIQNDGELKDVKQPISNTPDEVINDRVKDNVENEHDGVKLDNVNTKPIREHVDEHGPDYDYTVNGDGYERDKHGTQEIKGDSAITQNSDDTGKDKDEPDDDTPSEEKTNSQSDTGKTDDLEEKDDTPPIDTMPVGQTNGTDTATDSPQNASKRGKYKVKEWQ